MGLLWLVLAVGEGEAVVVLLSIPPLPPLPPLECTSSAAAVVTSLSVVLEPRIVVAFSLSLPLLALVMPPSSPPMNDEVSDEAPAESTCVFSGFTPIVILWNLRFWQRQYLNHWYWSPTWSPRDTVSELISADFLWIRAVQNWKIQCWRALFRRESALNQQWAANLFS